MLDLPKILLENVGFSGVILFGDIIASLLAFLNILNPFNPNFDGEYKLDCGDAANDDDDAVAVVLVILSFVLEDGDGD